MDANQVGTEYSSSTTRRRYMRRSQSPGPWWPWGLLPLLGLFVLYLWGALRTAPYIQEDVKTQVIQSLRAAGVLVDEVLADGQDVVVRVGSAPVDARFVQAVAEAATCSTWRGQLDCPLNVRLDMAEPVAAAPAPATPAAPAEPAPVGRHHDFMFTVSDRAVRLVGEVASTEQRVRIVNAAKARFEQIDDQLRVSGQTDIPSDALAADRALMVLERFDTGEVRWQSGELNARGRVPTEADVAPVRDVFYTRDAAPALGDVVVQVAETVDRCNNDLAAALNQSTIRFRTSSAQIDAGNDELLIALAELIEACPGTLTVEGHTDSIGDDAMNLALSQARADAVRTALVAMGVPQARLNTRGFGETQPVADNGTRAGRAQNRRIVISIDDL